VSQRESVTQNAVQQLAGEIRAGQYPDGQPMPSESQLAARFGVSRMTVRVVLARLERDGLVYRQQGKGTFARRPLTEPALPVALWLKELGKAGSPYMSDLIAGADTYLSGVGAHVSVTGAPVGAWSATFCQGLAGVIVVPFNVEASDLAQLRAMGLRYVTVQESDLPGPVVGMGPLGAARAVTEGLLALGHRRFGLVSGHQQHVDRQKRYGIGEALAAAGLSLAEVPDLETGYDPDRGRTAAQALLCRQPRPTAIIAFDDTLALQVLSVAQQSGLRVPDDLSVTGFNDSPFSALITPPLSTVRFPVRAAGAAAAVLIHQAHARGTDVGSVYLEHELCWRGSTGRAAQE